MRNSKKRLLSLALSMTMIASLLPSVGANAAVNAAGTQEVWTVAEAEDTSAEETSRNVAAYKNGGKAYADSVMATGGDIAFLNDGTYSNRWVAADATLPVKTGVKFAEKYSIDRVKVVFDEGKNYDFTVSYYNPVSGGYTELYKGSSYNEANENGTVGHPYYSEYVLEEAVITNDVRVTITSAENSEENPIIAEIEVYGKEYDATKELTNLAIGKPATASYVDWGRSPANAIDGSVATYWDGGKMDSSPQWMMVDLGDVCEITEIKATTYYNAGDGRYYFYYIEASEDGKEWTKIADREETYGTEAAFKGESYTFDNLKTRYIRVTEIKNSVNNVAHMQELEIWGYPTEVRENIALGKTVIASNADLGCGAERIVDGDYTNYWDGGAAPQSFTIDLGSGYFVDTMKAYPYTGDGRMYLYTIEYSLDGSNFTHLFDRTEEMGSAYAGEAFQLEEPVEMRFVRVTMTHNTANASVHMKEFEIYGEINPDYQAPTEDLVDPDNIAFGRTVRTHLATDSVKYVTDGLNATTCSGEFAPAYFDIDLEENYDLDEVILNFPVGEETYYYYTIYGSVDGSNYDRLYQKRDQNPTTADGDVIDLKSLDLDTTEYRIVRVYMEYAKGSNISLLSEIRIHGTATGENKGELRTGTIDEVLNIKPFSETEYAEEITEAETIENVYGIIERNLGKEYRDWFTFRLAENTENDNDYFMVGPDAAEGKILVTGNDGVSLASGLNYYLENYCHVQISEQTSQVNMPEAVVEMKEAVRCETPYKVRYAFNYCTLNYTFSYADAEIFQREYDWLALSGVNCVLDLAGQEAVWIKFLQNFGYSFDEAKDWIAGPTYYAWQFMDNMEVVGGPVSDEWVTGRLEMARENQRFKNSLGMQTVFQGYAGMIPCNFADYQPEVEILDQGTWCNLPRPDMIRTDGALYDQYAELFYAAQEWAFGANSDYYAVDPFHEGGIRPDDLSDEVIAAEVLDSLLKYDKDAVWMVQAWWSNPSNELLKGMGDYRQDHVLILDLTGIGDSKWDTTHYGSTHLDAKEFNGTDWVCCLLDNYGGNPSMDGNLQLVIDEVVTARDTAEHMKGIGLISEATYDNPALYQMLFDMTWVSEGTVDMDEWLDLYLLNRYGAESENARKAWEILEKTIYGRSGHTAQVMASTGPGFASYGLPYSTTEVEKALSLLFKDFDVLCDSEAYMYDLSELMRQIVNNYAVVELANLKTAYEARDLETYKKLKEKFLNAFDILEDVLGTQKDLMAGNWIGRAEDWALDTGADDFAYDTMVINAKTIITVWAPTTSLGSYAYRNYQGMFDDIYKPLWQNFLDRQEEIMENGSTELKKIGYTETCMDWIYAHQDYEREADNSPENMRNIVKRVIKECSTVVVTAGDDDNVAADGTAYAESVLGGYSESRINDGNLGNLWIAKDRSVPVYCGISFDHSVDVYGLQIVAETRSVAGANVMDYYIEAKNADGEWELIYTGDTYDETTKKYTTNIVLDKIVTTDDIRLTFTSNGGIYPALAEMKVYSSAGITVGLGEDISLENGILNNVADGTTVAQLKEILNHGTGELVFTTPEGQVLNDEDAVPAGTKIQLVYQNLVLDEITVAEEIQETVFEITKQPESVVVSKGEAATVTVEATGTDLTYTWYYKNPGNKKFYVSGDTFANGNTYSIPMFSWRDGQQVYCVITDANGETLTSETVTLSLVKAAVTITKQPESVVVEKSGDTATVTVEATGTDLTYTWYYKNPGNVKFYVSGNTFADGNSYSIPVNKWRNGQQVYCVITDANGLTVQTETVTLTLK